MNLTDRWYFGKHHQFHAKGDTFLLPSKGEFKNSSSHVYSLQTSFIIPFSNIISYPNTLHFPHPGIATFICLISNAKLSPSQFSLYLILRWHLKTVSKLHSIVREPETLTLCLHFLINGLVPSAREWAGKLFALKSMLMQPTSGASDLSEDRWYNARSFPKLLRCPAFLGFYY